MSLQTEPKGISAGSQLLQRIDTKIVHDNCELLDCSTVTVLKECCLLSFKATVFNLILNASEASMRITQKCPLIIFQEC